MLKMTIDNEEVVSKNNFTIKEEMLSPSSTILNNTYPKSWEDDKNYTSRFYYPKDYAKLDIQNFSITPEEAGTTIDINGSATLTDVDTTKESRVLSLKGQTSQTTYTGKNLLPYPYEHTTKTTNGVTFTDMGDGSIKINGTASGNANFSLLATYTNQVTIPGNYIYGGLSSGVRVRAVNHTNGTYTILGSSEGNSVQINKTTYTEGYIELSILSGTTVNNLIVTPMLTNTQDNTYEPYVGGTTSPNPQYPQPINVVSGDNEIDICGKNLWHYDTKTDDGWYTDIPNFFTKTGTYTLSINNSSLSGNWAVYFIDSSKQRVGDFIKSSSSVLTPSTFNVSEEQLNALNIRVLPNAANLHDLDNYKFQVEKGNQATTYEPYIGNSYPISLGYANYKDIAKVISNYALTTPSTQYPNGWVNETNDYTLYIPCKGNTEYKITKVSSDRFRIATTIDEPSTFPMIYQFTTDDSSTQQSITTNSTAKYLCVFFRRFSDTLTMQQIFDSIKIEEVGGSYIELCKIGTYQDSIYKGEGYNLLDINNYLEAYTSGSTGEIISISDARCYWAKVQPNQTYTFSRDKGDRLMILGGNSQPAIGDTMTVIVDDGNSTATTKTFTNGNFEYILVYSSRNTSGRASMVQINEGTTALPYEPYNSKDKWLLHKEIGKVVLDGSEAWAGVGSVSNGFFTDRIKDALNPVSGSTIVYTYCDNFVSAYRSTIANYDYSIGQVNNGSTTGNGNIIARNKDIIGASNFNTWLSTHKTTLYYVLATPTTTLITNTTLLEQLDDLESQ